MIALICETCGAPATARSATSYACDSPACRGPESTCGSGQTWENFAPTCEICAEVGDPPARATWARDDPGFTLACDGCRTAGDEYARTQGETDAGWRPIGPAPIPPSLVSPPESRLNPAAREGGSPMTGATLLPWPICEVCEHVCAVGEADDGTILCAECASFGVSDGIVESFAPWAPDVPRHVVHATDNPFSRVDGRCAICDAQVFDPAAPEKGARSD